MADRAVGKLTQVTNHAAIGNCFMVAQKGAGAGSTNRSSVSALQIPYASLRNAYPFGNGDGNAYGARTVSSTSITPAFQTINDIWYDVATRSEVLSYSTVHVMNQSTNSFILAPNMYVKQAGAWTQIKQAWIKDNGVWRKFLNTAITQIVTNSCSTNGWVYNVNLYNLYRQQTGDTSGGPVNIEYSSLCSIGSLNSSAALDCSTIPAGSKIKITLYGSYIIGKAGNGQSGRATNGGGTYCQDTNWAVEYSGGSAGGPAIALSNGSDYTLNIPWYATIGGGGGGGQAGGFGLTFSYYRGGISQVSVAGGGGAGCGSTPDAYGGTGGSATATRTPSDYRGPFYAANGSFLYGGQAVYYQFFLDGGHGGDLGQAGYSQYNYRQGCNGTYQLGTNYPGGAAAISNGASTASMILDVYQGQSAYIYGTNGCTVTYRTIG
jgi:hypothetical protein